MKLLHALFYLALILVSYLPVFAGLTAAPRNLQVLVPESAGYSAQDRGLRSHTRLRVLIVPDAAAATTSAFNTPSSIHSLYNLPSTGGSNAIAIVDAYHYPTALADFNAFAGYFGLPQESSTTATSSTNRTFQVVYAPGYAPQSGGNYIASWNLEAALDIEWAHAMAPNAKIYLVEAASDSNSDLFNAVHVAASLSGVKEVSMSWGGSEASYEAAFYDAVFSTPGVVYFASGGDTSAQMEYPAASPNVVSCGGTSVNRASNGAFVSETGWSDTGCGPSAYEPRPSYQNVVASVVGSKRGVSDLAFDADPNTGVYVYDTTALWGSSGWWVLGGTSVSSPSLAGVVNLSASSGGFAANTAAEQARIYGNLGKTNVFRDITSGTDGSYSCKVGYDFITGVGVPNGLIPGITATNTLLAGTGSTNLTSAAAGSNKMAGR
jgi:subtilase family serine protease